MEQVIHRNGEKIIRIQDREDRVIIEKTKQGYTVRSADSYSDDIFISY